MWRSLNLKGTLLCGSKCAPSQPPNCLGSISTKLPRLLQTFFKTIQTIMTIQTIILFPPLHSQLYLKKGKKKNASRVIICNVWCQTIGRKKMKWVSFWRNCGATSVGEYNRVISIVKWVEDVNWPPLRVSKLTLRVLALRQSEWRRSNALHVSF